MTVMDCVAMQQCEDLEDGESLRHMYHIIRGAVMLNDANLLDLLLAEENVMDVVSSTRCHYTLSDQYQVSSRSPASHSVDTANGHCDDDLAAGVAA